jgi:holo-[acyl-carrier protein] synthase
VTKEKSDVVIIAHGIDMVEVRDFSTLAKFANDQLSTIFTESELADVGTGQNKAERLAGRFAAKEAVLKALGKGFGCGIAFTDVEVILAESGAPSVLLRGNAHELSRSMGITAWLVSTSHTARAAVASAIGIAANA